MSERNARPDNLVTSLCAVLLGRATTGLEPLILDDNPALRHDQLSWVSQNYIRDDTHQRPTPCCRVRKLTGGVEVAPADGMRLVVPVRTVHAGPNAKYFGAGRDVTWYP